MFALDRALWAYRIWFAPLPLADHHAIHMVQIADYANSPELKFEANHARSVTLFGIGDFPGCHHHAARGRDFCLGSPNFKPDFNRSRHLFGEHDGRLCCKMFVALCRLLNPDLVPAQTEDASADQILKSALDFAEEQDDPLTNLIAQAHAAMYCLLKLDFQQALRYCAEGEKSGAAGQWLTFNALLKDCASIGAARAEGLTGPRIDLLIAEIEQHQVQWRVHEYRTLWLGYEAVAHGLAGNVDRAQQQITAGIEMAESRTERLFLPELQRYGGWLHHLCGQTSQCTAALVQARIVADQMGAALFRGHIDREAQLLGTR